MGKITKVTVGIEDRFSVVKYHSIGPSISLTVEVGDDEDVEAVVATAQDQLSDAWEKAMCRRLWQMIDTAQRHQGPMPDQWALNLYRELFDKHFAGNDGTTS